LPLLISGGAKGTGTKEEPAADKTALTAAITDAKAAKTGIEVNTAAVYVPPETQWVTQAVLDTFNTAIDVAKAVAAKAAPTQAEVNAAETALKTATTTFNAAKQAGTKPKPGTGAVTLTPPAEFTDLAETVLDKGPTVTIYRQGTEGTSLTVTVNTTGLEGATYKWMLDNTEVGTSANVTVDPWDYFPGTHYFSLEVTKAGAVWSRELTVIIDSGSK
jgi:hypothetical protein